MEAAILESLRAGHSIRAACAAAGVAERTYHRFAGNSQAHRHDREIAMQEAERRLVGIVLAAAATDAKHAEWLLSRRWPALYGDRQQIDMNVEQQDGGEILALARRYAGMTDEEIKQELRRLAWVEAPAHDTGQERIAHDPAVGVVPLLPAAPTDETPDDGTDGTEAPHQPELVAHVPPGAGQPAEAEALRPFVPAKACPHCEGDLLRHQPACPVFLTDGRLRVPWMAGGDPR